MNIERKVNELPSIVPVLAVTIYSSIYDLNTAMSNVMFYEVFKYHPF